MRGGETGRGERGGGCSLHKRQQRIAVTRSMKAVWDRSTQRGFLLRNRQRMQLVSWKELDLLQGFCGTHLPQQTGSFVGSCKVFKDWTDYNNKCLTCKKKADSCSDLRSYRRKIDRTRRTDLPVFTENSQVMVLCVLFKMHGFRGVRGSSPEPLSWEMRRP